MSGRLIEPASIALLALLVLPTGCSLLGTPDVTPTRYFVLTSDRSPSLSAGSDSQPDISIGLGPFTFPAYLDRPQMVSREEPNQVTFSQFNRWAEPVKTGFVRVLGENIGRSVGTEQIVLFPWYEIPLEFQVKGEVLRFEVGAGEVRLECIWTIYRLKEKKYLLTRHADLRRPVSSGDPDEVAAALSDLVSELGHTIGLALIAQHSGVRRS